VKQSARTTKSGFAFLTMLLVFAAALVLSGNAMADSGVPCAATGMESVSTPRDHYQAGEVATISGGGYATFCDVQVDVERPDGVVESFTATTDLGGTFSLDYQVPPPPGVLGQYRVVVRGLNGAELASTTFEDAPAPQFDVAPSHVKTTGTRTFSVLVRNVASGSGDTARCVRVITGSNFDVTSATFVVANPGTSAGQTGNWQLATGTNFVQIRNNENAPGGRGLLGQALSDPNWVRFEITVNVQAIGTQMWRAWMNTNGTADCTSGSSDDLSVRAGGSFTRDYGMDFRDASGNVIAPPSTTSGGAVDYRVRITRANSGDDLSYAAIAAPTCLSNIAVVSVTDPGSPNFQAHVSDNFVRLVSSSSNPSFSGTKLATNGEWVQVHFTATAACSSSQPFRSAAWKNTSPEAAEGDIFKLVPSVSINNVTLAEGNSGTQAFGFAVTLSHADDAPVTVNYATANSTATAGSDYTAVPSTTLTFAPGETIKTVNVTVSGDTSIEPDETFFVNLTSPSNAFIADGQGVGTILNDDNSLTINDVTLTEGNSGTKSFNFTVTLSPAHASTVTVQYATANGTAMAGSDYVAHPTTTLTFTAGQTTKTVTVLVNGDNDDEADETFFVNLFNSTNATITDSQGVGTILNDENEAPVAVDDSYSTDEDTPLNVAAPGVLGNDTDADGDALTAMLVDDVANGTLDLESDGSFTYTPNANANGSDSFTYKANDGAADSDVATVTLTVNAVNDAPTCEDVTLTTDEDAPGSTSPDCSDVEGDSLTYEVVEQPAHGTAGVEDGELTYQPNANFNGSDSFTYRSSDGSATSDTANVAVTVNAVNDAPLANDDSYDVDEDTTLTVEAPGVLGNDTDVEGDELTAVLVTDVSHGSLTLNSDGSFAYSPDPNYSGSDSFTYRANDGTESGNVATVTITVNAVNDAPVAANDAYDTDEDTTLNVSAPGVLGNDSDVDGDSLEAALVSGVSHGSLMLNADGSFSYEPNGNFNGEDSFTYQASDGEADSNVATVTITVNPVNDAPTCEDVTLTTDEDAPGSTSPDCSDVEGDSLTYEVVDQPAHGTASVVDGQLTYEPNANFNGSDAFTYRATDGQANSNTANVAVTVNAVNDAPTCEDVSLTTDEDAPGSTSPDCADVDGDVLTYEVVDQPAHGTADVVDGQLTYEPDANFNGGDSFTYRASDGLANSDTANVAVTVNAVNDAPVAANDAYDVDEDETLTVDAPGVLGNDSDVDGDTLEAELLSGVSHGSLTLNADGSFGYEPNPNFNGTDSFTYKAHDGEADSNVATVTITVNAVNDAPTCADVTLTTDEDTPGSTSPDCSDVDGDSLTYEIVDQPAHGTAGVEDGELTYTPNANFNGSDSFTYRANDGTVNSNTANVAVTVNPVNDAPVANDDSYDVDEDEALTADAPGVLGNDTDVEGDALTAVLVSDVAHGSLTLNADGSFTYEPNANFNGTDSFTYKANDGTDDGNTATVTITVNPVNDAPTAADDAFSTDEDTTLNVPAPGVLGNDVDLDGDGLEAALVSDVSHGSLTLNADGSFSYEPNANFNGEDSFTYQASDGEADSNVATVTITVNAVNDAPTVDAGDNVSGAEGAAIALDGDVDDVENDDVTVEWTYAAGAGVDAGATCAFTDPNAVDTTVTCTDDGAYTATLTATDEHGASGNDSTTVTVANAGPAVDISSPNEETAPVAINTAVNLASTFTDAGVNDTHAPPAGSCQINWGDGSTTPGAVTETPQSGSGSCTGTHPYAAAGVYTITVTVTDDDGGSGSDTAQIVVYDPNAGFVTGGGWIPVQAGSYTADPSAAGKGTFGFVSKYKKGTSTPEGQTEFNFQVAGFKFHSEAYKWLVVSGHKAQYTGTGRVNGVSGYDFRLTAYDGQISGGGGVDKFRLKITNDGVTVFDNRIAAPEHIEAADPQAIGGGSIVIHKAN
jgi:large repetitive protein